MSDEEFEYDMEDNDFGEDEQDDQEIEMENMFFEADDIKNGKPKEALDMFLNIIELESQTTGEKWRFKCLLNIILIKIKIEDYDGLTEYIKDVLKWMHKVSRNEANDAIDAILINTVNITDGNISQSIFENVLDFLKEKNFEQLWVNASLKLVKIYYDRKENKKFNDLLEKLKESCRLPDGSDDLKKSSVLLEIYSLEINFYMQSMNLAKLRDLYTSTKNLSSVIADPRTMGTIKDIQGKMLMLEKDWETSRVELLEAFKLYQSVGNPKAKAMLKYLVVSSILARSSFNPFDNLEAKVYKDDVDISVLSNLRIAFEQKNTKELNKILSEQQAKIFDDPFLLQFKGELLKIVSQEVMLKLIKPYKRIKLSYLAGEMNLEQNQLQSFLSELILDRRLLGRLNLIDNCFENDDVGENTLEKSKNQALLSWIKDISNIGSIDVW